MAKTNKKSVLVVFGDNLPRKNRAWWRQFDEVICPARFKDEILKYGNSFSALEKMTASGSVQRAHKIIDEVSGLTLPDDSLLCKAVNWRGYELWWMYYDSIYYQFCLPYTQYDILLSHLKEFDRVFLFQPVHRELFCYFLKAHGRRCVVLSLFRLKNLVPLSFGIWMQLILSFISLPLLLVRRPKVMIFTGDKFDQEKDYDFRYKFIYEELRQKKIDFVEFVRSLDSVPVILKHAWRRKRPVFYSTAFIKLMRFFIDPFSRFKLSFSGLKPEDHFWFMASAHYLNYVKGGIAAIRTMGFLLRVMGVKAAIIPSAGDRTFHEVLACKTNNILTVGIQHGASPRYFFVSDFMHGFDGSKSLSLDKYGLWSEWWKNYYLKHSSTYREDQLHVAGHMRPLEKRAVAMNAKRDSGRPRVLFISEQLADPREIIPFLSVFLEMEWCDLCFKFRPYRDGFEEWLKKEKPEVLEKIKKKTKIFRGDMQEAVGECDVVTGSYSTAVLEALLQLKTPIFFLTQKWGDYFDMGDMGAQNSFLALNPEELESKIRSGLNASPQELEGLRERFFGDPYRNGSGWVVKEVERLV